MSVATVLVVDDDPQLADLYAELLSDTYTVKTTNTGDEALAAMDHSINVVVLDRRLPERSGDEILEEIRARGHDCPVIMVTAVNPDVDIIDLSITEYLTKPISGTELRDAINWAHKLSDRDTHLQEYFALLDKQLALKANGKIDDLATNADYLALQRRVEALYARMSPPITSFETELAERLTKKWPHAATEPHLGCTTGE